MVTFPLGPPGRPLHVVPQVVPPDAADLYGTVALKGRLVRCDPLRKPIHGIFFIPLDLAKGKKTQKLNPFRLVCFNRDIWQLHRFRAPAAAVARTITSLQVTVRS